MFPFYFIPLPLKIIHDEGISNYLYTTDTFIVHPKEGALFLGNYIKVNISALKSAKDQCQTLILR